VVVSHHHGRKPAEAAQIWRSYATGRGVNNMKLFLNGHLWWFARVLYRLQLLAAKPGNDPAGTGGHGPLFRDAPAACRGGRRIGPAEACSVGAGLLSAGQIEPDEGTFL